MDKTLYFVDSIHRSIDEDNADIYVNLVSTQAEDGDYFPTFFVKVTPEQLSLEDVASKPEIQEGQFVFYEGDEDSIHHFSDGSRDNYAEGLRTRGEAIRKLLAEHPSNSRNSNLSRKEEYVLYNIHGICSYHVNVGHGNCSLILIKSKDDYVLWMVDCSIYERGSKSTHRIKHDKALKKCLDDIRYRVNTDHLKIDRFMLTHMHYDHYSGVNYLLNNGYFTQDTKYYINHYYECNSETMVSFLESIKANANNIIEPKVHNSFSWFHNSAIRILHPDQRILKKTNNQSNPDIITVNSANNASAVFQIVIDDISMVFPGDLEIEGFDRMAKSSKCSPWLHRTNFYAVSHHGSYNGHPDIICQGTRHHDKTIECINCNLSRAVLMGRDGAYSTMFNPYVVSCFNKNNKLVTTDMKRGKDESLKYLTIDWHNGNVEYIF